MSTGEARARLGLDPHHRLLLLFGQIAPYKGVIDLVRALPAIRRRAGAVRVVIAGKVKRGHEDYWAEVRAAIDELGDDSVIVHNRFIPDEDVEKYFMAADAVVLPYRDIYQSGVPFLAYSFGLPVIATRVGALPEAVQEGFSGCLAEPGSVDSLADAVVRFFEGSTYTSSRRRQEIRDWASRRHSWSAIGEQLARAYHRVHSFQTAGARRPAW